MKTAAGEEPSTNYVLGKQDCTHLAKDALNAGGLKNGETSEVTKIQGKSAIEYKSTENNYFPAAKQAATEKKNPGTCIDEQLKLKQ